MQTNRLTTQHRLVTGQRLQTASGIGSRIRPPTKVQDGQYTATIYGLLAKQKYEEAKIIIQNQLEQFPNNRAALSILAYCQYMMQDYLGAATSYEKLVRYYPEIEKYRTYHAQSLYKAGLYQECLKVCQTIHSAEYNQRIEKLQAYAEYECDELASTKAHLEKCLSDDPDVLVAQGCVLFKEEKYDEARVKFQQALNFLGYVPQIAYNIALCYYKMKQYPTALKYMQEIIEKGIRDHPELSVGSNTEGMEVRSVGNSQTLKETALVEAFNLKAAIEYVLKNFQAAAEALKDMPPRSEKELDAVTLHNLALLQMETDATAGFSKMKYLLQTPPFPPETFANLLLLYCKHGYYYLAADILVENAHLTFKYLSPDLYDFLQALIEAQTSPEEAFQKFDHLASKHIEVLRKLTKPIQEAQMNRDSEATKKALKEFDEALDAYIPVLMAMAKIYWDIENYAMVEKILLQSVEFCTEHDIWKLNLAHACFMQENQENKFKDAIRYYEPLVKKQQDRILEVPAMVLANLCVSYIMTSQNEEAEEWMKKIEKEEERVIASLPENEKQPLHLCIVNLVIGTLYCSKNHYEFGISRIIKSLEPYNKKIMTDTWYYAKRCFLSLIEMIAKHMVTLKDAAYRDIIMFLTAAETYGKNISTIFEQDLEFGKDQIKDEKHTVAYEARQLKRMFLKLRE